MISTLVALVKDAMASSSQESLQQISVLGRTLSEHSKLINAQRRIRKKFKGVDKQARKALIDSVGDVEGKKVFAVTDGDGSLSFVSVREVTALPTSITEKDIHRSIADIDPDDPEFQSIQSRVLASMRKRKRK